MTDTAKRLAGPTALTTSAVTQYTVPGATTALVRSIHVANETSSPAAVTLSVGTDGAGKRFYKGLAVPPNGALDWSGLLVLAAAEVIQAFSDTATALTLTVSGVEVS